MLSATRPPAALLGAAVLLGLAVTLAIALAGCSAAPGAATAGTSATTSGAPNGGPTAVPTVRQVQVSISDAGCSPQTLSLPAGPATFIVTNSGSASVLEYEIEQAGRIIGEVENVIPGINRSFTLNLKPGAYVLSCPGGTTAATGTLTVTE